MAARRRPRDEELEIEPLPVEELGGESEFSVREAGVQERGNSRRVRGGLPDDDPSGPDPEDLGRRFLEEATEAPGPHDAEEDGIETTQSLASLIKSK